MISLFTFLFLGGTPVFAETSLPLSKQQSVFSQLRALVDGINAGDTDAMLAVVSQDEEELRAEIQQNFLGQDIAYALDCTPLAETMNDLSQNEVKVTCDFAAQAANWNTSGFSTYFVLEKGEGGDWYITETDFHKKASGEYITAFLGKLFGTLGIVFLIVFGLGGAFWVWMLIDCIRRGFTDKTMWILLLVFLNILGAILYYFMIKRKDKKDALLRPSMKK